MLGKMQMQCCRSSGLFKLSSTAHHNFPSTRKVVDIIQANKDDSTKSDVKRALLAARKKERIKLPSYENARVGETYHISQFLNHPTGVEAMLNVNVLENYDSIDVNTYRCKIPPIQLLNFEVAPVLDLQVSPASECCTVELLSCKFEGSEIVESQNKYFSATMKNLITWDKTGSESFLDVDVKLNIALEIYNQPFKLLPVSTVEAPGNIVLQALLDRFVPLLLQQLLQDYDAWVTQQQRFLP
ncbi:uncharacterized protein LOC104886760 isoform X1 [Beta vulgaris subsp. vulgaris]|uniref:uncharacterized protein LOC104886760 isoform X1 n=2 Tax=Beta vulgaris subsp. vulgaris TaxID=3555 RepID=UPI0020376888|nr:uncharacterized protein LOC104886760 isoform X1 [Beta vulgaris subsp. vulgaris]